MYNLTDEDIENNLALFNNSLYSIGNHDCDVKTGIIFLHQDKINFEKWLRAPYIGALCVHHIFDSKFGLMFRNANGVILTALPLGCTDYVWVDNHPSQRLLHDELLTPEEIQKKYNVSDNHLRGGGGFGSLTKHNPVHLDVFLKRFPGMTYHMNLLQLVEFKA